LIKPEIFLFVKTIELRIKRERANMQRYLMSMRVWFIIIEGILLFTGSSGDALAQRQQRKFERTREPQVRLSGETRMVVKGQEYFYSGGRYYRRGGRGYAVVGAPIGARLRVLPVGFVTVRYGRVPLFLSFGTYYRFDPYDRAYVVVAPPPDAPATPPASPGSYDKINLAGGEVVTGTFLGGTSDSIQVQVGANVEAYAIDQVASIQFASPEKNKKE
jgi:hypothetical protein